MERVLDIYKRSYNPKIPVVCMDESPKQLIDEAKKPLGGKGHTVRYDYEYIRNGVCNIFMANEPLAGTRLVKITRTKKKRDWAEFVKDISDSYQDVEKIILVMDNYNTHKPGSLYEAFEPEEAKKLLDRFEFVYTPKHGSWLNMAEIELNVIQGQCLNRRIGNIQTVIKEVKAWEKHRNSMIKKIDWQFSVGDARIKLKRLYPVIVEMT